MFKKQSLLLSFILLTLISFTLADPLFNFYLPRESIKNIILKKSQAAAATFNLDKPEPISLNLDYKDPDTETEWTLSNFKITLLGADFAKIPQKDLEFKDNEMIVNYVSEEGKPFVFKADFDILYSRPENKEKNQLALEVKTQGTQKIKIKSFEHTITYGSQDTSLNTKSNVAFVLDLGVLSIVDKEVEKEKPELLIFLVQEDQLVNAIKFHLDNLATSTFNIFSDNSANDDTKILSIQDSMLRPIDISLKLDDNIIILSKQDAVIQSYSGDISYNKEQKSIESINTELIPIFKEFDGERSKNQLFISNKFFATLLNELFINRGKIYFSNSFNKDNTNILNLNIGYLARFMPDLLNSKHKNEALYFELIFKKLVYGDNDQIVMPATVFLFTPSDRLNIVLEINLELQVDFNLVPNNENDSKFNVIFGGPDSKPKITKIMFDGVKPIYNKGLLTYIIENTLFESYFSSGVNLSATQFDLAGLFSETITKKVIEKRDNGLLIIVNPIK